MRNSFTPSSYYGYSTRGSRGILYLCATGNCKRKRWLRPSSMRHLEPRCHCGKDMLPEAELVEYMCVLRKRHKKAGCDVRKKVGPQAEPTCNCPVYPGLPMVLVSSKKGKPKKKKR